MVRWFLVLALIVSTAGCATSAAVDEPRDPPQVEKLRLRITKVRNAIDETRRTIARAKGADYLPELYVRLAELLSEEAKYHYQLAYEREQRSDRSMHVPQVRLLKEDAIGIYERVLEEFPDSALVPRVLFNIGHEHRELGNFEEMKSVLRTLAQDHPNSHLRYDALLVLGDYHFDKQEFRTADRYYGEIIKGDLTQHTGLAYYKRAWVRVNRGDCEAALGEFEKALDRSASWADKADKRRRSGGEFDQIEGATQQGIDVRREALVDLTYCYSRERKVDGALAYLKERAYNRSTYVAAVSRLASRYRLMDKFDGAIAASRELLKLGPADEIRLDDARTFYAALKKSKSFDDIGADVSLIADMLTRYYSRSTIDTRTRSRLVDEFEAYIRDLATTAQEELDDDSPDADKAVAVARAYEVYIETFPRLEHIPAMLLNVAEVHAAAARPYEAGRRASQAAQLLEDDDKRKNALYDALVYFQESLQDVSDPSKFRRVSARATLRGVGSQLLDYELPEGRRRRVKFAVAQTYYDEGSYEEAIDRLTAVAYEFPQTEQADASIQHVLDSYNTLSDFDGLMYASRRFLGEASPATDGFKGDIRALLAAAEQRKLDELSLAAAGEDGGDLDELVHFAEQNPNTEVGERALVNAFVAARAVGDTDQIYELADKLAQNYPNSEQLPGIYNSLAVTATSRFEFDQALEFLESAASVNEGQRARILTAAAQLQAELGRVSQAESTFKAAIEQAEGTTRGEALAGLARLLERHKSPGQMVAILRAYDDHPNPEFQARLGLAYLAQGDQAEAEMALSQVLADEAIASAEALARAHYGMGEIMRQTLHEYPTPSDLSMVQEFIALVELTQQSYLQAARQGSSAVSPAALSRLGTALELGADKLIGITLPAELSASDKEQIKSAMEQRAQALRATAQDAFDTCSDQAYSAYNFSPVVRKCLQGDMLAELTVPLDALSNTAAKTPAGFDSLRQDLAKNPDDADKLQMLGEKFLDKKHYHAARLVLQEAVEAGGGPLVYHLLGQANEQAGDVSAALEAYALAAEANHQPAKRSLTRLLNVEGLSEVAGKMERQFAGTDDGGGS